MIHAPLLIALGSTASVGKDTLFTHFNRLDRRCTRYAFADPLKKDIAPFLMECLGIDIWRCTAAEKELVRPLLIAYGMAQRQRDPDYWVKRTVDAIQKDLGSWGQMVAPQVMPIPVVTDCRFINEAAILRATFPGFRLVNVTREGAPLPTAEEEKHWRDVAALADVHFHWGNESEEEQRGRAAELLRGLMA